MPSLHYLSHLPLVSLTGRLLLAVLLGGLVGWERERHERPAGLRTHVLVCVGAALITVVSSRFGANGDRMAAQVVTGVGFLGAGTIIRDGTSGTVRGLTTAASLWAVAGVGIAAGYGGQTAQVAALGTLLILGTLGVLSRFEETLIRQRRRQELTAFFHPSEDPLSCLSRLLSALHGARVRTRDLTLDKMADAQVMRLQLTLTRGVRRDSLDALLRRMPGLVHYEWGE